jgi:thioredoxin reductase (NADPH)
VAEKLIIIGSGPAGWTAAIYAARANLDPLLYEGEATQYMIPGGQLMFTTEIENYPGFPEGIGGQELMARFRKQAERFGTRIRSEDIVKIDTSACPFRLQGSGGGTVEAHAVIIATGARANWLNLPNEQRLARSGGGVSACAVCDGALPVFRNKELVVVGGGDSAMEETDYLTRFASKVYLIHRREELRASKIMQKRVLENPKVQVVWNSVVVDVLGDSMITAVRLKNVKTNEVRDLPCGGLFLAIGHTPNTEFVRGTIDLDEKGYIVCPRPFRTYTSVEGIFAAGDVMDSYYRQAVSAAGTGCMAALDAERWLATKGVH